MFVRKKTFKNDDGTERTYLNLVENKKIDGKVVQTNLYNLGRIGDHLVQEKVDQLIGSLLEFSSKYSLLKVEEDLEAKSSQSFGLPLFFKDSGKKVG